MTIPFDPMLPPRPGPTDPMAPTPLPVVMPDVSSLAPREKCATLDCIYSALDTGTLCERCQLRADLRQMTEWRNQAQEAIAAQRAEVDEAKMCVQRAYAQAQRGQITAEDAAKILAKLPNDAPEKEKLQRIVDK